MAERTLTGKREVLEAINRAGATLTDAASELDDLATQVSLDLAEVRRLVGALDEADDEAWAEALATPTVTRWVCALCMAPLERVLADDDSELRFTCAHEVATPETVDWGAIPTIRRQEL